MFQYFVQENKFYLILSAYLKFFEPCGYFLKIKKTQGSLRLLREVSGHSGKVF